MTKDELKKEAETEYRKQEERCKHSWNGAVFRFGYIASAKPREKRIVELEKEVEYQTQDCKKWQEMYKNRCEEYRKLEKENKLLGERCNQLLKDKGDLTDRVAGLEKENERLNKLYTLAKDVVKQFLNDCVITNDVLDKIEPLVKEMKIEY